MKLVNYVEYKHSYAHALAPKMRSLNYKVNVQGEKHIAGLVLYFINHNPDVTYWTDKEQEFATKVKEIDKFEGAKSTFYYIKNAIAKAEQELHYVDDNGELIDDQVAADKLKAEAEVQANGVHNYSDALIDEAVVLNPNAMEPDEMTLQMELDDYDDNGEVKSFDAWDLASDAYHNGDATTWKNELDRMERNPDQIKIHTADPVYTEPSKSHEDELADDQAAMAKYQKDREKRIAKQNAETTLFNLSDFSDAMVDECKCNTCTKCGKELTEVAFSDLYKSVSDPSVKPGDTVTWKTPNSPYGSCGKVIAIKGNQITVSQGCGCTQTILRDNRDFTTARRNLLAGNF